MATEKRQFRLAALGGRLYRGEVSVDFVGRKKLWYTMSGIILLVSLGALLIGGLNFSVDFKGGDVYKFTTPAAVHLTQSQVLSTAISGGAPTDTIAQQVGSHGWSVQTQTLPHSRTQFHVLNALAKAAHLGNNKVSLQAIGPTWGGQISQKALEALIGFLIVIVLYLSVAFEWRMAAAAFVALAHDIVITVGVYALVRFEVSPATVIGLLTILGYSLYDTVVVFDKVRENTAGLLATRRTRYSEAANLALNQTLVRSINTSLIALLPVVAILVISVFLLGNGELKDLSLVLFVGMLSGTYSSICIATPVLADLKERQPEFKQLAKQIAQRATSTKRQAREAVAAAGGARTARGTASARPGSGSTASAGTGSRGVASNGTGAVGTVQDAVSDEASEVDEIEDTEEATAAPLISDRPVRVGPRQQPRRSTSSQRKPSSGSKKKRR